MHEKVTGHSLDETASDVKSDAEPAFWGSWGVQYILFYLLFPFAYPWVTQLLEILSSKELRERAGRL